MQSGSPPPPPPPPRLSSVGPPASSYSVFGEGANRRPNLNVYRQYVTPSSTSQSSTHSVLPPPALPTQGSASSAPASGSTPHTLPQPSVSPVHGNADAHPSAAPPSSVQMTPSSASVLPPPPHKTAFTAVTNGFPPSEDHFAMAPSTTAPPKEISETQRSAQAPAATTLLTQCDKPLLPSQNGATASISTAPSNAPAPCFVDASPLGRSCGFVKESTPAQTAHAFVGAASACVLEYDVDTPFHKGNTFSKRSVLPSSSTQSNSGLHTPRGASLLGAAHAASFSQSLGTSASLNLRSRLSGHAGDCGSSTYGSDDGGERRGLTRGGSSGRGHLQLAQILKRDVPEFLKPGTSASGRSLATDVKHRGSTPRLTGTTRSGGLLEAALRKRSLNMSNPSQTDLLPLTAQEDQVQSQPPQQPFPAPLQRDDGRMDVDSSGTGFVRPVSAVANNSVPTVNVGHPNTAESPQLFGNASPSLPTASFSFTQEASLTLQESAHPTVHCETAPLQHVEGRLAGEVDGPSIAPGDLVETSLRSGAVEPIPSWSVSLYEDKGIGWASPDCANPLNEAVNPFGQRVSTPAGDADDRDFFDSLDPSNEGPKQRAASVERTVEPFQRSNVEGDMQNPFGSLSSQHEEAGALSLFNPFRAASTSDALHQESECAPTKPIPPQPFRPVTHEASDRPIAPPPMIATTKSVFESPQSALGVHRGQHITQPSPQPGHRTPRGDARPLPSSPLTTAYAASPFVRGDMYEESPLPRSPQFPQEVVTADFPYMADPEPVEGATAPASNPEAIQRQFTIDVSPPACSHLLSVSRDIATREGDGALSGLPHSVEHTNTSALDAKQASNCRVAPPPSPFQPQSALTSAGPSSTNGGIAVDTKSSSATAKPCSTSQHLDFANKVASQMPNSSSGVNVSVNPFSMASELTDAVVQKPRNPRIPCFALFVPNSGGITVCFNILPPGHLNDSMRTPPSSSTLMFTNVVAAISSSGLAEGSMGVKSTDAGRRHMAVLKSLARSPFFHTKGEGKLEHFGLTNAQALVSELSEELPPPLRSVLDVVLGDAMDYHHHGFHWAPNGRSMLARSLVDAVEMQPSADDSGVGEASPTICNPRFSKGADTKSATEEAVRKVQSLLLTGEREAAVEVALQHRLHTHAILIAMMCPKLDHYKRCIQAVVEEELLCSSPLAHAYCLFNEAAPPPFASIGEAESHLAAVPDCSAGKRGLPCSSQMRGVLKRTWCQHAAMLISNPMKGSGDGLLRLGDDLQRCGLVVEAHTCFLMLHLSPYSASAYRTLPEGSDPLPPLKSDKLHILEELRKRLGVLGGYYHPLESCRTAFLSPLTILLTDLLQEARLWIDERVPLHSLPRPDGADSGPKVSLHGIPSRPERYAIAFHFMGFVWLREAGLHDDAQRALQGILQAVGPPQFFPQRPPRTLNELVYIFGQVSPVKVSSRPTVDVANRTLDDSVSPTADSQAAVASNLRQGMHPLALPRNNLHGHLPQDPPHTDTRPPGVSPPVHGLSASPPVGMLPLHPSEGVLPPPPGLVGGGARAPPPPAVVAHQSAEQRGDLRPQMHDTPSQSAAQLSAPLVKPSSEASAGAEALRAPVLRGRAAEATGKQAPPRSRSMDSLIRGVSSALSYIRRGKSEAKKDDDAKPMILNTDQPPLFDPATGRYMFPKTDEEVAQEELVKKGPPKLPNPESRSTPSGPSSGPPIGTRPPGMIMGKRPGPGRRTPQYADTFNSC